MLEIKKEYKGELYAEVVVKDGESRTSDFVKFSHDVDDNTDSQIFMYFESYESFLAEGYGNGCKDGSGFDIIEVTRFFDDEDELFNN